MSVELNTIELLRDFNLLERITEVFDKAERSQHLVYSEPKFNEIIKDKTTKIQYELKTVEALSVRPNNRATEPGTAESVTGEHVEKVQQKDPFLTPEPELTIVDSLLEDYRLVLNKYPNSKYHFLLVTKEFEKQDSLLKPIELLAVRAILKNLNESLEEQNSDQKWFAFFNSGPESGYSQYHKHIQFMLLPSNFHAYQDDVIRGQDFFLPKESDKNRRPLFNAKCTFKHYILLLKDEGEDEEENEDMLAILYMYLVNRLLNIFREHDIELSQVSYNFMMTDEWMMVVPRSHAKHEGIWQNALGYMGLFNAKDEEVKDKMVELGFQTILKECGFEIEEEEDKIVYNEYGY